MSIEVLNLAFYVTGLTPTQKAILIALANYANPDGGHAFPSVKRMSLMTSCGERTVRRALSDLRDMRLIEVVEESKRHKTTEYQLDLQQMQVLQLRPDTALGLNKSRPARAAPLNDLDLPETTVDLPERHPSTNTRVLLTKDYPKKGSVNDKSLTPPGLFNLGDLDNGEQEKETGKKEQEPTNRNRFSREMQDTFCAETGIPSPDLSTGKQRRAAGELWFNPLWSVYKLFRPEEERQGEIKMVYDQSSLNAAIELIKQACRQMKDDKLTISFPKSIYAVAQSIYAEGNFTPQDEFVDEDPWAMYKQYAPGWQKNDPDPVD